MRINFFSAGHCTDINAWSGVPYYFYRNLLASSFDVRAFDLNPSASAVYPILTRIMAARQRVLQVIHRGNTWDPMRCLSSHRLINRHLQTTVQQHADVDLNLFLTFTFSSYTFAPVPVVHYCDRTYEHYLEDVGRTPTRSDREFIRIDRQNIENAALVLTTGELCADFIKSRYNAKRVFCLKLAPRTDVDVVDPDRLIAEKENSTDILFIGRGAYRRGVDILIGAFKTFNERNGNAFTLHIVGVQPNELPEHLHAANPNIRFHGFLNKADPKDLQRYDKLLRSAKMFVMPMRPGPFPGVIKEAQLLCTPVIASRIGGLSECLVRDHDSVLVDSLEPEAFAHQMDLLVRDAPRWRQLARNGHVARRDYTWSDTVGKFVEILRDCSLIKN
jgi:glycosyltransferase involved in cell wall biosynthesis